MRCPSRINGKRCDLEKGHAGTHIHEGEKWEWESTVQDTGLKMMTVGGWKPVEEATADELVEYLYTTVKS